MPRFFQPPSLVLRGLVPGENVMSEVGGVVGGVIGSLTGTDGGRPSSIDATSLESVEVVRPVMCCDSLKPADERNAAERLDDRGCLGDAIFAVLNASGADEAKGALPVFLLGEMDLVSTDPEYVKSGILSAEVQGLTTVPLPLSGATEFKNGFKTLSFINS